MRGILCYTEFTEITKKRGVEIVKKRNLLILLLVLLLTGCSISGSAPSYLDYAPEEENRLVVYTSHKEEVWWPIITEFEERTGIWVDVVCGGTYEMLGQIESEADAPVADVMFGGGVDSLASYEEFFAPYRCSQADSIFPQYQSPEDLWTPFSALPIVLIYNNKLVSANHLTSWEDLLSERFRGKIAFTDPEISGSCYSGLVTMLLAVDGTYESTISRFCHNLAGQYLGSSEQILTMVADGSAAVGITLEESALKQIAAGANITMVYPQDGTTMIPDGTALIKGAPHEENAKRFIDFTVSEDVQSLLAQFYRRPVCTDMETAEALPAQDSISLIEYDLPALNANRQRILSIWNDCKEDQAS